jgi:hypothetical protein
MNQDYDLEQLWRSQPVSPALKGEDMRKIVLQKMEKFDRKVHTRNRSEVIVAGLTAMAFSYFVWAQQNSLARLGAAIVVASLIWIVFYILRRGTGPVDPNPDQSLAGYRSALVSKIDYQIRLLRSVKYWYLLPMYVGLLTLSAGWLQDRAAVGGLTGKDAIGPVIYTVIFGGIWWLNEVYAVRKLRAWREQLASGAQESESC